MEDHPVRTALLVLLGAIILWMVLASAIWGLGVATAGIYGRGEAHKRIQGVNNRIFQQERFHTLEQDVKGYTTQIANAKATDDAHRAQIHPGDGYGYTTWADEQSRLDSVVLGLRNQCVSTVREYNADAQKVSARQFRDASLPETLDEGACA